MLMHAVATIMYMCIVHVAPVCIVYGALPVVALPFLYSYMEAQLCRIWKFTLKFKTSIQTQTIMFEICPRISLGLAIQLVTHSA